MHAQSEIRTVANEKPRLESDRAAVRRARVASSRAAATAAAAEEAAAAAIASSRRACGGRSTVSRDDYMCSLNREWPQR